MMFITILIFAKAPQPNRVKTRLIPALGAERAALLARLMLQFSLDQALASHAGHVELCSSPGLEDTNAWQDVVLPPGLTISHQGGGDLGQRMARAVQRHINAGHAVLVMGTDCPALDAHILRQAATALSAADAVIIPTFDGGYALLGLRQYHPSLFTDIPWSTSRVAQTTLQRMQQLQLKVVTLATQHDIDEPRDLCHLPDHWSGFRLASSEQSLTGE